MWAVALSADEGYLACTTSDGRINVWDIEAREKIQTYETGARGGGSFAMAVDLSRDGRLTASGHESGAVYVFNNDAGRMVYSLSGASSVLPLTVLSSLLGRMEEEREGRGKVEGMKWLTLLTCS